MESNDITPRAPHVDVAVETILLRSDAPDVILARDTVGASYLCSLTSIGPQGHHYLAVQVSDRRLAAFRSGEIDLRAVLTHPELPMQYAGWLVFEQRTIALDPVARVPEEWLPAEGFLLTDFEDDVSVEEVVRDSLRTNSTVIVCGLNPREARGIEPKVNADRLADYIRAFQTLVREATRKSVRTMPDAVKSQFPDDASVLQVFAFSPGSFNVHFQAQERANLIGTSVVGRAMQQIDDLMELATLSPDDALKGLTRHRGVLLGAYENMMRFIAEHDSSFSYRWSEPAMTAPQRRHVTPIAARSMIQVLETEEPLKSEEVNFVGRFTSVNTEVKPFSWQAREPDFTRRRGYLHENFSGALEGVTIRTMEYVFSCEERLVRLASGATRRQMYLKSVIRN